MSSITYSTYLRDFKLEKRIGKGNCATVAQVLHLPQSKTYALKMTELNNFDELSHAFNEIQAINCLQDPFLVKIAFFYVRDIKKNGKIELGMIMELCGLSLLEEIKRRKMCMEFFTKEEINSFIQNIVELFSKMQRKGYIHRDIKPDNILLSKYRRNQFKVADLGFSIKVNYYSSQNIAGTMEYVSPKLLVKFKEPNKMVPGNNFKDDVYSLGQTLLEMLTLEIGAKLTTELQAKLQLRYGENIKQLISQMMKVLQKDRPDFIDLEEKLKLLNQKKKSYQFPNDDETASNSELKICPKIQSNDSRVKLQDKIFSKRQLRSKRNRKDEIYDLDKVDSQKKHSESTERSVDELRTKKKENKEKSCPKLEAETNQDVRKKSKGKNGIKEFKHKMNIKVNESVNCLLQYGEIIILGLDGKIGIVINYEKMIKVKVSKTNRSIVTMKLSQTTGCIYFSCLDSIVYSLPLTQLTKIAQEKQSNLKRGELATEDVKFEEYKHPKVVSCFELISGEEKQQKNTVLMGYYTGEISYLDNKSTAKIETEVITCLRYKKGWIYISTLAGVFKRYTSLHIDILPQDTDKMNFIHKYQTASREYSAHYFCNSPIIGFELIDQCKANIEIIIPSDKYLAMIIEARGFFHIVSKRMECVRLIKISTVSILGCYFMPGENRDFGGEMYVINDNGAIINSEGVVLAKTEVKGMNCLVVSKDNIICGSFEGIVSVIDRRVID